MKKFGLMGVRGSNLEWPHFLKAVYACGHGGKGTVAEGLSDWGCVPCHFLVCMYLDTCLAREENPTC
jgi:hypothetical protein